MRILSGQAKGRVLKTREGKGTRPTDSRAREMLFNILGERVQGSRWLDLYAGTGAVGLEALSRGASRCIFVEQNAAAARTIRENIRTLDWQEQGQVWQSTVKSALKHLMDNGERFDLIFADPPFVRPQELDDLTSRLDNCAELLHNLGGRWPALLVIQHHWKARPRLSPRFTATQERRAGESLLSFFTINAAFEAVSSVVEPDLEVEPHPKPEIESAESRNAD